MAKQINRGLSSIQTKTNKTLANAIAVVLLGLSPHTWAQDDDQVKIIEPDEKNKRVKTAEIDTERFELGVYAGLLSLQNFNTNPVYGVSFSFHITDRWLAQLNYATSDFDPAKLEENSNIEALPLRDRSVEYTNLLAGFKLLDGRSFLGAANKYDSSFYLLAGVGETDFAEVSDTSYTIGFSYRVVITDYLTVNFDLKDHIFDQEIVNETETSHNNELVFGLNFLF